MNTRGKQIAASPGFTLVEVMLALFIALILLVGMNAVFRQTSDTIRAGQALGQITRNGRSVQPILYEDMHDCAPDSPMFVISSGIVPQYLNPADATANAATGLPLSGCELGDHLHRVDQLSFFARGLFKRKTANNPATGNGYLVSTTTSDEAYIHYGHLRMIGSDGVTPLGPDDYAGTSEPYAANWVLGRNVILLSDAVYPQGGAANAVPTALDSNGNPEFHYAAVPPANSPPATASNPISFTSVAATNLAPLGYGSPDYQWTSRSAPAQNVTQVQSSKYDIAGVSIDQFRSIVTNAVSIPPLVATRFFWWAPLVYQQPHTARPRAVTNGYPPQPIISPIGGPVPVAPYGTSLPRPNIGNAGGGTNQWFPRFRYQASTILSPTPMTSLDQANLAPIFLEHVSQFIVEYAGDYLTQDNTATATSGNVIDTVPDGQIDWVYATKGDWNLNTNYSVGDYVIVASGKNCTFYYATASGSGSSPASSPAVWSPVLLTGPTAANPYPLPPKAIRWYGMPRDATGSGHVLSYYGIAAAGNSSANELNNVVPLMDVWLTSLNNSNTRQVVNEVETGPTLVYPSTLAQLQLVTDYAVGMTTLNPRYTAVWQNDVPAMVRILIKVDDPNNDVKDGPWFEYVFKLK